MAVPSIRQTQNQEMITIGGGWKQCLFANQISRHHTPSVRAQYEQIGGSSIDKYTDIQGSLLGGLHPSSAPHKNYVLPQHLSDDGSSMNRLWRTRRFFRWARA